MDDEPAYGSDRMPAEFLKPIPIKIELWEREMKINTPPIARIYGLGPQL